MNVLADIIQPTDVCLDIGANIGIFTILMCQLSSHVVSFEPSDFNANLLAANVSENGLETAKVVRCALGAVRETKTFVHLKELPGCSFVNAGDDPEIVQKFWNRDLERTENVVQVECLDDWLPTHGEDRVDFIKMDVEGSERDAIQGGWKMFSEQKPNMVIEFNRRALQQKNGVDPRSLWDLLILLYSHIYVLDPDVDKAPIRVTSYDALYEHLPDNRFWADVLCWLYHGQRIKSQA
ncbi:FkbM family methyltransferase [Methyloligella solikamskensis]|uniref:FkbM family methyltransferase n=1 Tax=Methyloligella solikamskensis TaxID=1177756 RepID=A0ABW3JAV8_9HYPH